MDELASFHVPPLVIRTMARARVLGAAAARFAAQFHVAGRTDFLYVADSKLCSRENMDHIDRAGGRFVTVLPRNRLEDKQFRKWIQTNTPDWTLVWDRPQPRYADGPRDRWFVFSAPLPSSEGWSVVWVW